MTEREIDVLARTVYGEARNQPWLGKLAVAYVILNRARRAGWWGSDVIEVCLHPKQFSMWNTRDPNRIAALRADLSDAAFRECLRAAVTAFGGAAPDPTGGADHYHHRDIAPKWAVGKAYRSIGDHRFYRLS